MTPEDQIKALKTANRHLVFRVLMTLPALPILAYLTLKGAVPALALGLGILIYTWSWYFIAGKVQKNTKRIHRIELAS